MNCLLLTVFFRKTAEDRKEKKGGRGSPIVPGRLARAGGSRGLNAEPRKGEGRKTSKGQEDALLILPRTAVAGKKEKKKKGGGEKERDGFSAPDIRHRADHPHQERERRGEEKKREHATVPHCPLI